MEEDVIVVGAGIAGLVAAHRLAERGRPVLVLEREARPGGRLRTESWEGCRIELGAHFLGEDYARLLVLIDELGLRDRLHPVPGAFRARVLRDGRWHHVDYWRPVTWPGFGAVGWSDLLSAGVLGAKLAARSRAARFDDVAAAPALDDGVLEGAASRDAVRYLLAPLYQSFFAYAPAETPLSLVGIGTRFHGSPLTLQGGMGQIATGLAGRLDVRCGVTVESVSTSPDGNVVVTTSAGDHHGRRCVLAVPAPAALELLDDLSRDDGRGVLHDAAYSPFQLAYARTAFRYAPCAPDGEPLYMDVVPPGEHERCGLMHISYDLNDAPEGGLLFTTTPPGSASEGLSDAEFEDWVRDGLEALHPELHGSVTAVRRVRWRDGLPRFPAGTARRLAAARDALRRGPVVLAGDWMQAPWLEGAVVAGEAAADAVASG